MPTVLDRPASSPAPATGAPAAPGPHALVCKLCGAAHPASPSATCEECLGPLEPGVRPRPRAARCRHDRRARADAVALPRVAAVRWGAGPRSRAGSRRWSRRPTCAPARRGAGLGEERHRLPPVALVQGPGSRGGHQRGGGSASTRSAVRRRATSRTPSQRTRRARAHGLDLHPRRARSGQGRRDRVYGPKLVRVRGTYDDVNRLCAQVADRFGWGIVNVNLRGYYGEGSKTLAYEIAEQLGWRLPTAVVAPMAGGSLVTKLHKGFGEFLEAGLVGGDSPRLYGAQAEGCAPIVRLVERGGTRRTRGAEYDRALDRDRQPGGRRVRRRGDARTVVGGRR